MKPLYLTTLFLLGMISFAYAQAPSVFEIHPNPIDTVTTADTFDSVAEGEVKNISADTIYLKWERTIVYLSPGVTTAVCDPVTCWDTPVETKNFMLGIDSFGQMTVHFYNEFFDPPPGQPGSGIVRLKITNLENPADTLSVLYSFSTLTGTKDLPEAKVKFFPNPASDFFTLENAEDVAAMRLFTLDGRVVARFENNGNNSYSIANQAIGAYILSFEDHNGQLFQAVEIYKH